MILIIGGGLSGLLTAYRLKQNGIPFKILEARSRIGGRIHTIYGSTQIPVEMGATWFNDTHSNLKELLHELKIDYFEQYMKGSVFYQPSINEPVQSIQIPSQAPSYRISGGSSTLIQALYSQLDSKDILLNQTVKEIKFQENSIQVIADEVFEATNIVMAIPPKLWSKKIIFNPSLPLDLMQIAAETHTWMEDSIKIGITYKEPFWQKENQSGALFTNAGPITELYDHCNHERSTFALCGFLSTSFKQLSLEERKSSVMTQLKNAFGKDAENFIDYNECIWSKEKDTFEANKDFLFPHQNNGNPIFSKSFFNGRLLISSAESSPEFSGYMDGAVFAGNKNANKLING